VFASTESHVSNNQSLQGAARDGWDLLWRIHTGLVRPLFQLNVDFQQLTSGTSYET
jgi:hypothetical protein